MGFYFNLFYAVLKNVKLIAAGIDHFQLKNPLKTAFSHSQDFLFP